MSNSNERAILLSFASNLESAYNKAAAEAALQGGWRSNPTVGAVAAIVLVLLSAIHGDSEGLAEIASATDEIGRRIDARLAEKKREIWLEEKPS